MNVWIHQTTMDISTSNYAIAIDPAQHNLAVLAYGHYFRFIAQFKAATSGKPLLYSIALGICLLGTEI